MTENRSSPNRKLSTTPLPRHYKRNSSRISENEFTYSLPSCTWQRRSLRELCSQRQMRSQVQLGSESKAIDMGRPFFRQKRGLPNPPPKNLRLSIKNNHLKYLPGFVVPAGLPGPRTGGIGMKVQSTKPRLTAAVRFDSGPSGSERTVRGQVLSKNLRIVPTSRIRTTF